MNTGIDNKPVFNFNNSKSCIQVLTMTIPKGGRGKKAPYETQQMRVPIPIKDQVNILISKFRGDIPDKPNNQTSAELENLQAEIENLKTALDLSEKENQNLKTALEETNQQVKNLSASLHELKQKPINLNTDKPQGKFDVNSVIGEGEVLKYFNLERRILRTPREKGEVKVNFKHEDGFIYYVEYIGQPKGKGTTHIWKITKIEDAPQSLSLPI